MYNILCNDKKWLNNGERSSICLTHPLQAATEHKDSCEEKKKLKNWSFQPAIETEVMLAGVTRGEGGWELVCMV